MLLLENIVKNVQAEPDKRVLADDLNPKGITSEQLWAISGKVYAYLKEKKIGKENFVMVCLPRGTAPILALVGILRAGAAFVLVEDTYAPERIEYIRRDVGCSLVLDQAAWMELLKLEPLEGYEKSDDHDAAFAVYTSGTTGNPKGVIHEYGNIDNMIHSIQMKEGPQFATAMDRFALVAPLNFIASLLIVFYGLYFNIYNFVVAYATLKNPIAMLMFLLENGITGTFLTPSYIRMMEMKPPMLEFCIIGAEPADGIYLEGLRIHNCYLMSESGFVVTQFLIDKRYEKTPVGKNQMDLPILLLDEDGKPVPVGEEGEICFPNPYVRGYVNLPEETAKAFVDGIYHTADLGRMDEEGNLFICGRMSEMVKINGNRVEPGEIENVAKRVLGTEGVACRAFTEGKHAYVCLYYIGDTPVNAEETRKKMQEYLPYYMIPSFFIPLEEFPMTPTGKLNRKGLPAPDLNAYRKEYVAPRNPVEEKLCSAFEKVLKLDKVGIHEDFYELGGDSMGSIEVISECGLKDLTAADIFRGRTPAKIAELYGENHAENDDLNPDEINRIQQQKPQPLDEAQRLMVDYQLYTPFSTMHNLYTMVKFDKGELELERMAEVINKAVRHHSALTTVFFFNEDGEIMQRYAPELFEDVKVEKISEEEMKTLRDTLVRPFGIIGSSLTRMRLFETPEAAYLFGDIHHAIADGTSVWIFMENLMKAYFGQEMEPDYYYYVLYARRKAVGSKLYEEAKGYFEKNYSGPDYLLTITQDHPKARENTVGKERYPLGLKKEDFEAIEVSCHISINGVFCIAAALATAFYEKDFESKVMVTWIYNGRDSIHEISTVGPLFREFPVVITAKKERTIGDLFADVAKQTENGIKYSCCPYIQETALVVEDDCPAIHFQNDLRNFEEIPGIEEEVDLADPMAASQNLMDLQILNRGKDGLILENDYNASRFEKDTIDRYSRLVCAIARKLLDSAGNEDTTVGQIYDAVKDLT